MSRSPLNRRIASAVAIGVVAVALGVTATVLEGRPAHSTHAAAAPGAFAPAGPGALPAVSVPEITLPAVEPELDGVTSGSDGVLRIDGHVIVNKSFSLPADFGPGDLTPETVAAFEAMRADAASGGIGLWILSGYRSYAHQAENYDRRVAQAGVEVADRGMARPGHSEHQTGLAIDVNDLSTSFGQTTAGQWVAANAHRFGFVVRYPDGKEGVTGFKYEPWHLRYLGVDLATTLHSSGLTVEEYYGIPSTY